MADPTLPAKLPTHLNDPAAAEVRRCVARFQSDLLAEASRLEAASKSTSGDPEITSTMVSDADLMLRRAYRKPKQSGWFIAAKGGAVVGGFLTGLLADLDKLTNAANLVVFIVLVAVTVALTIIIGIKE